MKSEERIEGLLFISIFVLLKKSRLKHFLNISLIYCL